MKEQRCFLISTATIEPDGERKALICAQDITDLKRAEAHYRQAEQEAKHSLNEKIALLQEIHHRVKNNLQIICSLLTLQAESVQDHETAAKLADSERRVRSMAIIHEHLYQHEDMSSIDLAEHLRDLLAHLFSSYAQTTSVNYQLEARATKLTIEQAIPCGLILNELITNAIKYAYPNGEGEILIRVSSEEDFVTMMVSDQGIGLPRDFNPHTSASLGMTLIQSLTGQLNGQFEVGAAPGASFTVRFIRDSVRPSAYAAPAGS